MWVRSGVCRVPGAGPGRGRAGPGDERPKKAKSRTRDVPANTRCGLYRHDIDLVKDAGSPSPGAGAPRSGAGGAREEMGCWVESVDGAGGGGAGGARVVGARSVAIFVGSSRQDVGLTL